MELGQLNSCCGMGEFSYLEDNLCDLEADLTSMEEVLEHMNRLLKKGNWEGKFPIVIATTPEKERWAPIHLLLALAGFEPTASGKSKHGYYHNILWVYQK